MTEHPPEPDDLGSPNPLPTSNTPLILKQAFSTGIIHIPEIMDRDRFYRHLEVREQMERTILASLIGNPGEHSVSAREIHRELPEHDPEMLGLFVMRSFLDLSTYVKSYLKLIEDYRDTLN